MDVGGDLDTVNIKIDTDTLEKALNIFGVIRVFDNPDIRSQVKKYLENPKVIELVEKKIEKDFGKRWHHAVYRTESYQTFVKALRLVMIQRFYEEISYQCTFDGEKTVKNMLKNALVTQKEPEIAENSEKIPEKPIEGPIVH
jgi:hypothetical protein